MKKILNTLFGIGVTAICIASFTFAYTQEEIAAYNRAYKNGITTQPNIDEANLNGKLTRQELSKMLTNYIENVAGVRQSSYSSCSFTDEDKMTPNLKPYTKKICSYKIMGSNGEDFRPTSKVNRAELGTTISRMLWGDRYEVGGRDFYIYHLNALKDQGIMNNIENPAKTLARRGDTFIMLKRLADKFGGNIYMNESYMDESKAYPYTNRETSNNNKTSYNTTTLTQDEVQDLIEKEEGLKKGSLSSRGYQCISESCTYEFEYSVDGKKYIYSRDNKVSSKTEKIQDLGINYAEEVALKDAKVSENDARITQGFSTNGYILTIETDSNVFVYTITLDGKIKEKKTLITAKKALEIVLKEVSLTRAQSDIEKKDKEACSLSYDKIYRCSFVYGEKQYMSYINAEDGKFIPIKKSAGGGVQYGKSIAGTENVIISQQFTFIDSDKAEELLKQKYNIEDSWFSMIIKKGQSKNAIYVYTVDEGEYYIDAINGNKMNSKDEIIATISKDSGVSKDIIKNSEKDDDNDWINSGIIGTSYVSEKTEDVYSIYSFDHKGTTYTYKVRLIDGKILDSKKESSIGEDKAVKLAKQAIEKKYSPNLEDDYEIFNWSTAYIRYVSDASTDETLKIPSEPQYVVLFVDEDEENIYRAILKHNGNIISEDKLSLEDMGSNFLMYGLYIMGYDLDDLDDQDLNIGFSF